MATRRWPATGTGCLAFLRWTPCLALASVIAHPAAEAGPVIEPAGVEGVKIFADDREQAGGNGHRCGRRRDGIRTSALWSL